MKKLILFLLICISTKVNAQVYQEMPQYGYRANRMAFDSTLQIPTVCGVPTIKSVVKYTKNGAIAYDSCNAIFYTYNPKTLTWTALSGGGGSTDTTSLSNRINLKVNISDTSNMLTKYLRKTDTATLSNRINLKVPYTGATQDVDLGAFKISAQSFQVEGTNGLGHIHFKHQNSDATATGQSTVLYANSNGDLKYKNAGNYYSTLKTQQSADRVYTFQNKSYTLADSSDLSAKLNATDTASLSNRINLKLNISDTASMLSPYLRNIDTASLSNRINTKLNISDANSIISAFQFLGSSIKFFPIGVNSFIQATTNLQFISTRIFLTAIYVPTTTTVTGVKWVQGSAGTLYVGGVNYNGIALYSYNVGTGLCTRIDSTASDPTTWSTAGFQSKAFVTPISLTQGVYYIAAVCNGTATTFPSITQTAAQSAVTTYDFTSPAKLTGNSAGTVSPASFNLSTITSTTNTPVIALF